MNERGWNVKLVRHREELRVETASRGLECDDSESERRMSMKQSKIKGFVFFQTPENQLISHLKEQFTLKIHSFPLTCSVFFIFIHVGCFGSRNSDPVTGDDPETL